MIYLIKRIGFVLENRDPCYEVVEGYTTTKDKANRYIEQAEKDAVKYTGPDGETYPQFRIDPVKEVKMPSREKHFDSLEQLAEELFNTFYLEDTPYLDEKELMQVLDYLSKKNGLFFHLRQDRNVESDEIWYALDLTELEDGTQNTYENYEWLNYTR